ncbi:MAG: XdhC family protein [Sulfurovum sp.]|nr:MAG: XdhC family protein [Sulfurovum sp.]
MQNIDTKVILKVSTWLEEGKSVWFCTVMETYGAASRPPSSLFACIKNEKIGYLSRDASEDNLQKKLQEGTIEGFPLFYTYKKHIPKGLTLEEVGRCGTLKLLIEILYPKDETIAHFKQWLKLLSEKKVYERKVHMLTGKAIFQNREKQENKIVIYDNDEVRFLYTQVYKLLIIGISQLSMYLTKLAILAEYQVYICETRKELSSSWTFHKNKGGVDICWEEPKSFIQRLSDAHSAVLALAHFPRIDDPALLSALCSDSFYIGAIGSNKNAIKRKERLKEKCSEENLNRIHGPVGLNIRSKTPMKIAVSIMAEIILEQDKQRLVS